MSAGLALSSESDRGPNSTIQWLIDFDLYEGLFGGVCHDDTQPKTIRTMLPHTFTVAPKLFHPGVFRSQTAHIRFRRPVS